MDPMHALVEQLRTRGIRDERVLGVMAEIERAQFVPFWQAHEAHWDTALPIGYSQTISQPYVVAFMSEALALKGTERVLEIGTGSGYQAAVLAALCQEVYSVEIVPELAARSRALLKEKLGLANVHLREGDGHRGWPEAAPFDAILLTAAPERLPESLLEQLADGGRLVAPVGPAHGDQDVIRVIKRGEDVEVERLLPVRFVPMTSRPLPQ